MCILSPETGNCPSWISRKERMAVEHISWSISTKECCQIQQGSDPQPPDHQEVHPTEPPRPAFKPLWRLLWLSLLPSQKSTSIKEFTLKGKSVKTFFFHVTEKFHSFLFNTLTKISSILFWNTISVFLTKQHLKKKKKKKNIPQYTFTQQPLIKTI